MMIEDGVVDVDASSISRSFMLVKIGDDGSRLLENSCFINFSISCTMDTPSSVVCSRVRVYR